MLTVAEAQEIVLRHAQPLAAQRTDLGPGVLGLVIGEDVASDIDMPPHDKAMMDGFAVRSADLASGSAVLEVIEEVTAGRVPRRPVGRAQATRIMTGAPIPEGADAVAVVEKSVALADGKVRIDDSPDPGQHILHRGQEMRAGEVILAAGAVIRPQELGLLATVGRKEIRAVPGPRVAILATGDELVEADRVPGPGQIRNGNGPMLVAQAATAGRPEYLGIAADTRDGLISLIGEGLHADVLILSGGVSAGKLDLVPGVLQELGVIAHFHKIAMKPGKPLFFGTRGSTLVFGLPGNPVSSFVCFELFVRPALRRLAGHSFVGPHTVRAAVKEDFSYKTDRPTYHPAWCEETNDGRVAGPVPWIGSPDLRGLTRANCLMLLPVGDTHFLAGTRVPVIKFESPWY